jgi:hydroxymethylglutaryl-CoA reductase
MPDGISQRKVEHLDVCLNEDVEASKTLFDAVRFVHDSLPELAVEDVQFGTTLFGKALALPLLVTGMTGGADRAANVNRELALACERAGVAMGVGSQRAMLVDPRLAATYRVRDVAPNLLLFGNIGGVQLRDLSDAGIRALVESIGADALCVHLNPAQEMLQAGGDRDFSRVLDAIERAVQALAGRVIVKETGAGLSPAAIHRLIGVGVRYVDVSGAGGTSWTKVERLRGRATGNTAIFDDWGIPTAVAVKLASAFPVTVIGSGGVRNALDIARVLALGGTLAGFALPALKAVEAGGAAEAEKLFADLKDQLRFIFVNTGSKTAAELAKQTVVTSTTFDAWFNRLSVDLPVQPASPHGAPTTHGLVAKPATGSTMPPVALAPEGQQHSSRIAGFYKLPVAQRRARIAQYMDVTPEEVAHGTQASALTEQLADTMTENSVGTFGLPMGLGLNFQINGRDYVVPMVVEEPSVVAAASRAALVVRKGGGFKAHAGESITVAQIHLTDVRDPEAAVARIYADAAGIIATANAAVPRLVKRGGGCRKVSARIVPHEPSGQVFVVVHLHIDVVDAMGANLANTIAETVAPRIAGVADGSVLMRILSNYADERLARAEFLVPVDEFAFGGLPGAEVARRIVEAWRIADADPYRAVTHNKGVLNGIDSAAVALGQDTRAIEAAAHAWASRSGQYRSLTRFELRGDRLYGELEMPLQVTTVGPLAATHPGVAFAFKLVKATKARELACVMVAAGLAQNLAAVQALVSEGIQRGHMSLHQRRVAVAQQLTVAAPQA